MKATVVPNRNKIFASITQAIALSIANRTNSTCDIALGIHAERVGYFTPYLKGNKFTILQDGEELCHKLNINFDEVYKRTNTSYKPYPSGNSDYKSASSVERIEAFILLGRQDPVQYEDETGEVSYYVARDYVKQILSGHAKLQFNEARTSNQIGISIK